MLHILFGRLVEVRNKYADHIAYRGMVLIGDCRLIDTYSLLGNSSGRGVDRVVSLQYQRISHFPTSNSILLSNKELVLIMGCTVVHRGKCAICN